MKNLLRISMIIIALFMLSCQEIIDVDLDQGERRLVVEGRVALFQDRDTAVQEIRLSTTADYFSNTSAPAASNAQVTITDNTAGLSFILEEAEPGLYRTDDLSPRIGNEYELTIMFDGNTYRARETLIVVPPIDSIYQEFLEEIQEFLEGIIADLEKMVETSDEWIRRRAIDLPFSGSRRFDRWNRL